MRILLVSMNSIHFRRWSDQLRDSGHEVYWFDILDQGYAPSMSWMTQITGWKKGFLTKRGRTTIKKYFPKIYNYLSDKLDTKVETAFAKALQDIKPDVVHSFALYTSCLPILTIMNKEVNIKWIYSSWGSDLFYKENKPNYHKEVPAVLARVDYLFTDCLRDYHIAENYGFSGRFLGVVPGGGGFESHTDKYFVNNHSFIVKGYEDALGRCINVLKALDIIARKHTDISIIIFGASQKVTEYLNRNTGRNYEVQVFGKISNSEVIDLMLQSKFYIGNSISDGLPNTLLESIFCDCIPIQSNPGGATEEIIKHTINGFIISNPEDVNAIANSIEMALISNPSSILKENKKIKKAYERNEIQTKVLAIYNSLAI